VPLVFRVTNTTSTTVTLHVMGRSPTADFHVTDRDGLTIWNRLRGQIMLGALRLFPLGAGNELTFRHVWDGRDDNGHLVPSGEYGVMGVLVTDDPGGLRSSTTRVVMDV
jgi:intracellular proteinase inhibitor BsuPI